MVKSVLQDWVQELGLRFQGVLVSAIRGCDTVQRHDSSKVLARVYRYEILNTHVGDPEKSKSFILKADIPTTRDYMQKFLMTEELIARHNALVKPDDLVINVGWRLRGP